MIIGHSRYVGCLRFVEFAGGYWWWLCAVAGMGIGEGIIPVLLVLTAPDTRPRILSQPVRTHKWELAGCEQCVSGMTKNRFTGISLPGVSA